MRRSIPLAAMVVCVALGASVRADDDEKLVPSITVVGEGEVQVRPDTAHVNLGVATEADSASSAVKENTERMTELLKTLRAHDIADKHIQTSRFNVSPKMSYDRTGKQPPKIVGYTVTNQVSIKVVELSRLGAILDAVVQAGSNQIQGISFSVADAASQLDQARRKAMADALERAEVYASEAKVSVGKPLLIQEQSAAVPQPVFRRGMALAAAPQAAEVPIATGEQSITARVTVTYAIAE